MKVAIVGGGPAGFAAAIAAAKNNNEVTIIEKNSEVLKKLLLTGNGKCNYWNKVQDIQKYHSNSDISLIFSENNLNLVLKFWEDLGIVPIIKNGYYYPFSEKADSMKSALLKTALALNVAIKTNVDVKDLVIKDNKLLIKANDFIEEFDKIIIATGSLAYPKTGSTGWGYEMAKKLNHTVISVNPSLVQLITDCSLEKKWQGIRANVMVKHMENNKIIKEELGEIQLTAYGLSGICIFNLSRDVSIGLMKNKKEEIIINFVPWFKGDFWQYLNGRNEKLPERNITELCDAFINYKLLYIICSKLHIDPNKSWNSLSKKEQDLFCNNLTSMKVPVLATKSFDFAQVCSGGINMEEINKNTFESLIVPNLYFVGEVLDLDGDCGGYNLTIAILTGLLAGSSIRSHK